MGIFNSYTKPGKGVSKEDVQKSGIPLYFDIFLRRFWKFISINLLYIIASIPAIVISFFIANYFMGLILSAIGLAENEAYIKIIPLLAVLFTVVILQATGSGPASAAHTFVVRKYVKDTHAWIWSDFVSSFKQNFWQGMAVYIINVVVFFMIAFGYLFYRYNDIMPDTMSVVLSTLILILGVIFCIMQKYVYVLLSGFQLKVKHIYKNAFILTFAGLEWNIFSAVVIGAMLFGMGYLYVSMIGAAVAVILCFYFTLVNFTQTFITNNVVKKYIEEPALEQENTEE